MLPRRRRPGNVSILFQSKCDGIRIFRCKPAHKWRNTSDETPIWLKENVPCAYGICVEADEKTKAEKQEMRICIRVVDSDMFDYIQSIWSYLQPSEFKTFARNNIVGAIMIFSAIFWVCV